MNIANRTEFDKLSRRISDGILLVEDTYGQSVTKPVEVAGRKVLQRVSFHYANGRGGTYWPISLEDDSSADLQLGILGTDEILDLDMDIEARRKHRSSRLRSGAAVLFLTDMSGRNNVGTTYWMVNTLFLGSFVGVTEQSDPRPQVECLHSTDSAVAGVTLGAIAQKLEPPTTSGFIPR